MARIEVKSEITGTVWQVKASPGDKVESGDVLVVIESMKMEIPVITEDPGVVKEILVKEKDADLGREPEASHHVDEAERRPGRERDTIGVTRILRPHRLAMRPHRMALLVDEQGRRRRIVRGSLRRRRLA